MFDLENITRPNIKNLIAYSSARDEYKGVEGVFLDANENPYNSPYNRYPDPLQIQIKQKLGIIKGVDPNQIFLGNGSDEAIDLLIRAFCEPAKDAIVSINPTYGMYKVAADINAVSFIQVPLNTDFSLNFQALIDALNPSVKLVMLCSPNNPTANSFYKEEILAIAEHFSGLLVVDEAYIDFSTHPSLLSELKNFSNLVILQTFSKAWGLAGIRLGVAYASKDVISILNKIKYPYNVNILTQKAALKALDQPSEKDNWVKEILIQRGLLVDNLKKLKIIEQIYPSDANFLLIKVKNCKSLFDYLIDNHIITRDRSKVALCNDCIRITIGTKNENHILVNAISEFEKYTFKKENR
jgi:histidinol-phosphate aminotransferase